MHELERIIHAASSRSLLPMGVDDPQRLLDIIIKFGKRYAPIPIPKGLPRFRTPKACHRNACKAVLNDQRLTYVEGVAYGRDRDYGFAHAWVTMDGTHAIDLTLRGQKVVHGGDIVVHLDPPVEFYGVEIPPKDVERLMFTLNAEGFRFILQDWKR
jgi:hypothetical protein